MGRRNQTIGQMIAIITAKHTNTPSQVTMNGVWMNWTSSTGEISAPPAYAALLSAAFWHFGQTPKISSV